MAINNLEQAAMTAASTGVTPTRVPQYEDRAGDEWMSYVPEAYGQLPDAIRRQRQREVSELESGIPEAIRQAAQPMARRGLYGSGLQLEDIGQAALQRQIAIDKAKTLAEIDPLKAQIAMGDLAQQRGTQRAQESRRRYEKEEAYSQQQKARDDLLAQAAGSGILSTLTGRNPISDFIFGPQTSVLEKALLASATGGKGLGTAGTSQQSGLSKLIASIGAKTGLDKLLGLGGDTLTSGGVDPLLSDIEELGGTTMQQYTPWESSMSDAAVQKQMDAYNLIDTLSPDYTMPVEGYEGTTDPYADLYTKSGEFIPELKIRNPLDVFDDEFDFGGTPSPPRTDELGGKQEAINRGFKAAEGRTFPNPLDDPNLKAMNVTDTSLDYSPDTKFLPSEAEMLAGEGGSMYGGDFLSDVPFTDPTYGGFGEGVDLGTEGWDFIDDVGEGTSIFSEAGKAAGELVGKIPSTLGALAIASALNPEGIKGVAKNPLSFIGPQIMAQSGAGPLAIGKALATQTLPTGKALSSALTGGAVGLPIAMIGSGIASRKKARAQAEAEETRNRSGSARYNFIPGELWMAGNKRTSPVLDEANTNFRNIDNLTGMDRIYEEDPRRSVDGGKSLSERGQDFAREAGIDYTNPDPDIQNTSQKWLGKQQRYSELIPELKPVFMAGLRGEMPREQAEDAIAKITNRFFMEHPQVSQLININNEIDTLTESNKSEGDWNVEELIKQLKLDREMLKDIVPDNWSSVAGFEPIIPAVEIIEDEQE